MQVGSTLAGSFLIIIAWARKRDCLRMRQKSSVFSKCMYDDQLTSYAKENVSEREKARAQQEGGWVVLKEIHTPVAVHSSHDNHVSIFTYRVVLDT